MLRKGFEKVNRPDLTPGARHPAVMTNTQNNKKRLFLGRRPNAYILGLTINESEKLLNEIWYYATTEEVTWTQNWEVGDLLIWKNLYVLHKRDAFNPSQGELRIEHSLK